jgi:hypothetical protein
MPDRIGYGWIKGLFLDNKCISKIKFITSILQRRTQKENLFVSASRDI